MNDPETSPDDAVLDTHIAGACQTCYAHMATLLWRQTSQPGTRKQSTRKNKLRLGTILICITIKPQT